MKRTYFILLALFMTYAIVAAQDPLLKIMKSEVNRNFSVLKTQPVPAYYISYRVYETSAYAISTKFGDITYSSPRQDRLFHIAVRVGNNEMDNTREVKEQDDFTGGYLGTNPISVENTEDIKKVLWNKTDQYYKDAVKQYEKVKANVAVKVQSEDQSADFTVEKPEKFSDKPLAFKDLKIDTKKWEEKIKKIGNVFNENKDILDAGAYFDASLVKFYFVDTDGAEIVENRIAYRVSINASTIAEDGMDLPLYKSYFAFDQKDLPSEQQIMEDARELSNILTQLKSAPVAESFTGPAIMSPKAAGVFFHEIFGHRIEGARLKKESDAQTFKKKIGEIVLPEDFSVIFEPQAKEYKGFKLSGNYMYDDEGVKGQKVTIVENGKLKTFLMSRTPIQGISKSNGHGRGMIYFNPVTRQSNMFVETTQPKTKEQMRSLLIEEAKKTNKEFGYFFDEVSGGFTMTGRYMPNAFNVTPLIVYKIYTDGRPDELVRGVDLVGTPLAMFSQIAACGNEYGIFNGYCGAESGSVPVSSVTPSLFVKLVETQKKGKSQSKQPILERP